MKYKKIVCVVIDSFGIGQATDAKEFDDAGADTLDISQNIAQI